MNNQIIITEELETFSPHIKVTNGEKFVFIKNIHHHHSKGLATIITPPQLSSSIGKSKKEPIQVIILVHGHLSHKNAIYQPLLANQLSRLGYLVIRFDFRNQGDSEPNEQQEIGRTISQDINDFETIVQSFDPSLCQTSVGIYGFKRLSVYMVVAHSRGVLPTMAYYSSKLLEQEIPYLVNCCGRFYSEGLLERYSKSYPNWKVEGGFKAMTFLHGTYTEYWVPREEIESAGTWSTIKFEDISKNTNIINIYGTCDSIIPYEDALQYDKMFKGRSFLYNVAGADHNFYGLKDDLNVLGLPLRRDKVNYCPYVVALISLVLQNKQLREFRKEEIEDIINAILGRS